MPPVVPYRIPDWANPANASVLDSWAQKAIRTLGGLAGVADPVSQVMGLAAAPVDVPAANLAEGLGAKTIKAYLDPVAKPYTSRGEMQYPINYEVAGQRSPTSVFRGVTQDEMDAIAKSGHIKSTGAYSHPSEGTNFSDDFATAHSYVNYGRDNPARTGKPTYVLEVKRGSDLVVDPRDGYPKAQKAIPTDRIINIWSFAPDGSVKALQ